MARRALPASFRPLYAVIAAATIGALLFAGVLFRELSSGSVAAIGGAFAMTSADGAPVTDKNFEGRPYLVFFGYTHCPDFCPTTLTQISAAFKALGDDKTIAALFVSVDPERDTPAVMKAYLDNFDPRIVGLTGSEAQTRAMARVFKGYFKKQESSGGSYSMDHTGVVYLMDKRGRFVGAFNLDQPPQQAAAELARYL